MLAFEVYGCRDVRPAPPFHHLTQVPHFRNVECGESTTERSQDLYKTHLASPAMRTFLTRIEPTTTSNLDLAHYRLVAGVLDLPGDASPAGIMQDVRITCVSASARETLLASLAELVDGVCEAEKRAKGREGILTYMAFACLDDDVGVRILGRWRTRADIEGFVRRCDVGRFWQGEKGRVGRMQQRCYLPNGKGWLHRGVEQNPDGVRAKI